MSDRPLPSSIGKFINDAAAQHGERPALLAEDGRVLTHRALWRAVSGAQAGLRELGIGRRDRVAMVLPNGPDMAFAFLAAASTATAAPLNPAYRRQEFEFFLDDLRPRALLLQVGQRPDLRDLAAERGLAVLNVIGGAEPVIDGPGGCESSADAPPLPADVALILHTSGTTSRPKMVPLTQANLCASAANIARTLQLGAEDRCLNIMPHFHIHGLMAGLLAPLSAGGSVVCMPEFDAAEFLDGLERLRPTFTTAVPTMLQAVLERAMAAGRTAEKGSLRFIRSSSAALPAPVMSGLEEVFGCPVIESYGMTEAAHQMCSNPLPPATRKTGTVGPAAGPQVAVMDPGGDLLLVAGEVGEVVIRGDNVSAGYLENPAANESAFSGGWFRTGDLGFMDSGGYLTINGRLKEIVNRGGEKISPREVDEVLLSHPAVRQAVTFAVPDSRLGEEVAAAVILFDGRSPTEKELQQYVAARLAHFKIPRRILIVDEIPKGPTGKLQRIGLAGRFGLQDGLEVAIGEVPAVRAEPPVEAFVREQWAAVLGLDSVPDDVTFINCGGDSIAAMRLLNRINELAGVEMTIVDMFSTPTVIDQALALQALLLASDREGTNDFG